MVNREIEREEEIAKGNWLDAENGDEAGSEIVVVGKKKGMMVAGWWW